MTGAGATGFRPASDWIRTLPLGSRLFDDGKYHRDKTKAEHQRSNFERRQALLSPQRPPRKTKSPPFARHGPPHLEGERLYGSEAIQYVCPKCGTNNKIGVPTA